ncbi:MAG: hypothetical protein AAGI03_12810 [Pseudomonadota bacterium]
MTRILKPLLMGASLIALSACGLQGDLTRPDPLFGTPDAVDPAEPLNRSTTDGLRDLRQSNRDAEEDETNAPDPEDELLGGPSL